MTKEEAHDNSDDFESRICENCKYLDKKKETEDNKKEDMFLNCDMVYVETRLLHSLKDFGCNKWETK